MDIIQYVFEMDLKKVLIILVFCALIGLTLSCIGLFMNPTGTAPAPQTTSSTVSTSTSSTTSTLKTINYETVIRYINETRYFNITHYRYINKTLEFKLNISEIQRDLILNTKPDICHTVGCSDGYDKCKREILDILDWKKPKFREAWKTGYMELIRKNKTDPYVKFLIKNDSFGDYIDLKGSCWRVNHPVNDQAYNDLINILEDLNASVDLTPLTAHLTDRDTIILRRAN